MKRCRATTKPSRYGSGYSSDAQVYASMIERFSRKHEAQAVNKMLVVGALSHQNYRFRSLICAVVALCAHFVIARALEHRKEVRNGRASHKAHGVLDAQYEFLHALARRNFAILDAAADMRALMDTLIASLGQHCATQSGLEGYTPYTHVTFDANEPYAAMLVSMFAAYSVRIDNDESSESSLSSLSSSNPVAKEMVDKGGAVDHVTLVREIPTLFLHLLMTCYLPGSQYESLMHHICIALPAAYGEIERRLGIRGEKAAAPVEGEKQCEIEPKIAKEKNGPNGPEMKEREKKRHASFLNKKKKKRSSVNSDEANIQPLADSMHGWVKLSDEKESKQKNFLKDEKKPKKEKNRKKEKKENASDPLDKAKKSKVPADDKHVKRRFQYNLHLSCDDFRDSSGLSGLSGLGSSPLPSPSRDETRASLDKLSTHDSNYSPQCSVSEYDSPTTESQEIGVTLPSASHTKPEVATSFKNARLSLSERK